MRNIKVHQRPKRHLDLKVLLQVCLGLALNPRLTREQFMSMKVNAKENVMTLQSYFLNLFFRCK